jgi:hypothetical protein
MLDDACEGAIRKTTFSQIVLTHGDINLTDGQHERLWNLVTTIGGGRRVDGEVWFGGAPNSIDYPTFHRLFQPKPGVSAGGPATSDGFIMTLEEACQHFSNLNRVEALTVALAEASTDGWLPAAILRALIKGVATELSSEEIDQILRLAPRRGGPLSAEDSHDIWSMVTRFGSGRTDWDPVEAADRIITADVCRYISQQVEAENYRSFQDYVVQSSGSTQAAASLSAATLLTKLQRWLPAEKEFQRVAEMCILRLGKISPTHGIDLEEFYARFERLAKGGPAAAIRAPVGAGVGLQGRGGPGDEDDDQLFHSSRPGGHRARECGGVVGDVVVVRGGVQEHQARVGV